MALSGTLQTTATTWTENGITYYRSFLFSWSASQDITANKSTISWNIKLNITNNSEDVYEIFFATYREEE